MTLYISLDQGESGRCIRLHGRLTAAELGELAEAVRAADQSTLCVDLKDLLSADVDGLVALRKLREGGAELRAVPPYIALLLEDETDAGTTPARKENE